MNERVIYRFEDLAKDAFPAGLTLDRQGNLYTGLFGGGAVVKINPWFV